MDNISDTRRLADAALAAAMTEIMTERLWAIAEGRGRTLQGNGTGAEQKPEVGAFQPLLTVKQLAKHLGICARTVENWMNRGYVPYFKLGRNVRFKLADVEDQFHKCHRVYGLDTLLTKGDGGRDAVFGFPEQALAGSGWVNFC